MTRAADTIAAIATPAGRGGIGIVRVSGPACRAIARAITGAGIDPRHATYRAFLGADGAIIDRGVMLYFAAPASYTGEDVLELQGHGGPVVTNLVLRRVLELGARPARPGEFTERAFLNGRLDLLQAEAVADLINSQSERAARCAVRAMDGEFSRRIAALQDGLTLLRIAVEAALDFPEEDLDLPGRQQLHADAGNWLGRLRQVLAAARAGNLLRAGLHVVIAGAPNVGKSTLLNRLTGTDRAIVDALPGTTRDTIEGDMVVGGVRLCIIDTAGVRSSADSVEQEGVRRSLLALEQADLVLLVSDHSEQQVPLEIEAQMPPAQRRVRVRNKIDLCGAKAGMRECQDGWEVSLCAHSGEGIELLQQILEMAVAGGADPEDVLLAQTRHLHALEAAGVAVAQAARVVEQGGALELAAEELRLAQTALGRITGAVSPDDLLGEIFSRFCIGK
jgi:tRNA modification GTPase